MRPNRFNASTFQPFNLLTCALAAFLLFTAPAKADTIPPLDLSVYSTLSFDSLAGKGAAGTGIELAAGLSSTVKAYGFGEADDLDHSAIDRFGGGLRISGRLGAHLKPFAEIGAGYDTEREATFLRPGAGVALPIYAQKDGNGRGVSAALFAKWNLDVNTKGQAGQRISGGLTLGF